MCCWMELLCLLPPNLRAEVDRLGKKKLRELRLRLGEKAELNLGSDRLYIGERIQEEELNYVINAASRYSPWCAATMGSGYLTGPGGHRIGICGEAVVNGGKPQTFRAVTSLCIRVARDHRGIAGNAGNLTGSVLILGPPGWGKTTLLRELARCRGENEPTVVIDDRGELFPQGFPRGPGLDVLQLCPKNPGITMALRTMGPGTIAVDEITEEEDCRYLLQAANCGVNLLATAHGRELKDLRKRKVYAPLLEQGIFDWVLRLNADQSYSRERMKE